MIFNKQSGLVFATITVIISVASLMLSCLLNGPNDTERKSLSEKVGAGVDKALTCSFGSLFNTTLLTSVGLQFLFSFIAGGYLYDSVSNWVAKQTI